MYRKMIIIQLYALTLATATAQDYATTRRISSANGLSNDFVIRLALDGQGYVWVATEAGVSRIAGETCQAFPRVDFLEDGLVTTLCWHEPSNQMFIGSERGLVTYSLTDGEIRTYHSKDGLQLSSINDITPADGGIWLVYGNGHIQRVRVKKEGTGTNLEIDELPLKQHLAGRCALDDGQGHLYIGHSQHGMSVVNLADGSTVNYQWHKGESDCLPGNNVRRIYKDRQHRIWVGTDTGLALFNPATGTFSKVTQEPDIYDDNVYDICQMNDGSLWVATDIGGIKVVRPDSPALRYDEATVSLSSFNSRSVVQDEFGNIWVGNHSTGVDFISDLDPDFNLLDYFQPVYALANDTDDNGLWVAGEEGVTFWQQGRITGRWSGQNKMRREYSFPRCLLAGKGDILWVGLDDQGAYRFHQSTGQFEEIAIQPDGSDIHSFAEIGDGRCWIGAEFGVYLYQDGKATRHEGVSQMLHAPATCIMQTGPQQLFIATLGDGIYSINLQTMTNRHLGIFEGLPSGKIYQVVRSRQRGLWLATERGLVHLENPVSLTGVTIYGQEQGLADSHVLALQEAANGDVWMSTYSGISCLSFTIPATGEHTDTGRFYNYGSQDTRQSGGFAAGAAVTAADGTIYFGSAAGVCYFNPARLDKQIKTSAVQLISCEAYNPVGLNTELLQLQPDSKGCVYTTYEQNTLRLTFTVRNFAQAEHVEYSYMMKGMDNKWYDIDNDHDVVFRGLRPGDYTFVLRAKLTGQDWSAAQQTQLQIIISPPFWKTWWAYLLYILAAILWVAWLFSSYKRKLALRTTLELERRESLQKQELNEERLRFFTNITHELRTPLTLILGPLDDLMDDRQLPQQSRRRVAMIQKSAERLKSLINEILEFRKTETQNRRLTVARGDVGQFVREICLNYKELYRNPKVQFSYHIDDNLPAVYFDSEILTTILNNFLSNAIKYTEQGSITTTVRKNDGKLEIAVTDTGYGIAPEALPHIFERYYQAKGSHQASGTGIGLALVKSLAQLHEAQVSVDSHREKGSCFTLTLSIDNTYPHALHKEDKPELAPHSETPAEESTQELEQQEESGWGTPTLLIVEDNADIRQYIADSFVEDFDILQAENGEEGIQMANKHMPDIIVSDIMMPRMNGIQLTQQLKDNIRTSHIPIILLTAKDTDQDKEEGYDSGADSYLTKPFTAKLLASRIQNLLTARRRMAEYITRHPATIDTTTPDNTASDSDDSKAPATLNRLDREFLDKLNSIIRDNIMSQDIDLPFITDKMAMSHSTFYRKVKALTGMTAKEYIRKFRLQHCYQLLQSGDYNVTEAAMMTGFNQMAHFRETFKREFGMLPSEVMKKKPTS